MLPLIRPHYIARGIFGAMIVTSGFVQIYNIWRTVRSDTSANLRGELRPYLESAQPANVEASHAS